MKVSYDQLAAKLSDALGSSKHLVLAISGFGGSGKTTLAKKLKYQFPASTLIQLDNFLVNRGQGAGWAGGYDWSRLENLLKNVKNGNNLHYRAYDWKKDSLTEEYIDEKLPSLIIVEGVRLLQPKLLPYFDLTVWIDVDIDTASQRGIRRDEQNWEDKADKHGLAAHLNSWHTTWRPKDEEYFEKFRPDKIADFTLIN